MFKEEHGVAVPRSENQPFGFCQCLEDVSVVLEDSVSMRDENEDPRELRTKSHLRIPWRRFLPGCANKSLL